MNRKKVLWRFAKALVQWPFVPSRIENPRLIMTLLVKNEEEKLEQHLLFHHAMGVDAFIVTDNNSSDGTMDIIRKYQEKGWIVEVIQEMNTGYEQKTWVDRMVELAIKKHHANWIINADADEFWYAPSENLKQEMSVCSKRILRCPIYNIYPHQDTPFWQWCHRVEPVPNPDEYDLSPYSIYGHRIYKVAHRAQGYLHISMGNHKVAMLPRTRQLSRIMIYHYTVGNRETFMQKMIQGGRELEQHKRQRRGVHWRYFYRLYKEGKLSEEYDRVIGQNQYERLVTDGYIVEDHTICDFFRQKLLIK